MLVVILKVKLLSQLTGPCGSVVKTLAANAGGRGFESTDGRKYFSAILILK